MDLLPSVFAEQETLKHEKSEEEYIEAWGSDEEQQDLRSDAYVVYGRTIEELFEQYKKWGGQRDLPIHVWNTIIVEEVGEVAKALLNQDVKHTQKEIVQVIACLIQLYHTLKYTDLDEVW